MDLQSGTWLRHGGEFKKVLRVSKHRVVLQTALGKEEILFPLFKGYKPVIYSDSDFQELMRDTAHELIMGKYRQQVLESHAYRLYHDWEHRDWMPDIIGTADKNGLLFEPLAVMDYIEELMTLYIDTIDNKEKFKAIERSYQRQQALFSATTKREAKKIEASMAEAADAAPDVKALPQPEEGGCSGHCGSCSGHAEPPALPAPASEKPKEKPFTGVGFGDQNKVRT